MSDLLALLNAPSADAFSPSDLANNDLLKRHPPSALYPWNSKFTFCPISGTSAEQSLPSGDLTSNGLAVNGNEKGAAQENKFVEYRASPLILACLAGNFNAVKFLIEKGCDPLAEDSLGRNAIVACTYGFDTLVITSQNLEIISQTHPSHLNILRYILSHISSKSSSGKKQINQPQNCVHGITLLCLASYLGKELVVEELLKHGADVDAVDSHSATPLMYAARDGHIAVVRMLLKHGASPVKRDRNLWSALDYGQLFPDVATELRKFVARLSLPASSTPPSNESSPNEQGTTTPPQNHHNLLSAIKTHNVQLLSALLQLYTPASLNIPDSATSLTPLMVAIRMPLPHISTITLLLAHGADPNIPSSTGRISLHHLAKIPGREDKHLSLIAQRLISYGCKLDTIDKAGNTAIMYAAERGYSKLVTTLYEMGARLDVKNRKGKSIKDMISPDNAELKSLVQKYLPPSRTQEKGAESEPSVDVLDPFNPANAPSQPLENTKSEGAFSSQKRDSYSNSSTPRENRAAPFEVITDTSPLFKEMDHSPSKIFSSTPTPPTSSQPSSDRSTPGQSKPEIHPRQKSVSSIKSENLEHLEAVLNRLDAELSASENRTSQVAPSDHFDPPPPVERTDTAVQYSPPNPPVDIETPRISSGELTPPEWENRYTELVQQVNSLLESDPSFSTLSSEHRLSGTTVTDSPMKENMPDLSLPRSRPVSTSSFKRSPLKQNPMNKIDSGVSFSEPPHPEFDDEEGNETIDEDLDSLQMRYEILTENLAEIKNDIDEVQSALEKVKTDKIKIRQVERKLTARISELKSNLLSSPTSTLRQRDFATQTELNTIRNQLTEIKKRNSQADQFVQSYSNEFHRLCLDRIRLEKERKKVMKALKVVKRRGLFVETMPNLPRSRTTSVEEMEEIFVEELKREMEGDKELIENLRNELDSAKQEIEELRVGIGKIEKDRDSSKSMVDVVNRHRWEEVRRMMSVICTLSSLFPENALFDQLGAKTKESYDTITSSDLPETARSEHIKNILDDVCECYTHLETETNKVFLRNEELEKQNERLTKKSNDLELSVELLEGRIVALTANQNRLQDEIKRGSELLNMVSNAAARSPTKKKEHLVPIDTKLSSSEPAFGFDDFERTLEEQERSTLPTPPPSTAETSPVNFFKIDPKQKRRSTPPQSPSVSKPRRTQTSGTQTSPPQSAKKNEKPTVSSRPVKSQSTRPLARSDSSSSDSFPQSKHSRNTTSTSTSSRQDYPEFEDMSPVMETYVRALESASAAYQHLAASSPNASPKRRKARNDKPDVDWLEQFEMEWERRRDRLEKSDTFSTTSESSTSNSGNGSTNGNGDIESTHGEYERRGPPRPIRYESDEPEEDGSENVSDSDDEEDVLLSNIKRNGRSVSHSKSKVKSSPARSSSTGRVPVTSTAASSSRSMDKHQRRQQPTSCLKKSSKYEASFEPPPPPPKNENFFAQAMSFNNGLPASHSILKVSGKTVLPGMYQHFQDRSDRTESSSGGRKKKQHAIVEEEVDYGSSLRKVKSYANIRDRDVTSSSTSTTQNYRREPTPNSPKITSVRSRSRSISSSVSSGSHKQSQSSKQTDEVDYESRGRTRDSERESIPSGHTNGVSESRKKRSLSAFSIGRNRSKSRARSEYPDDEIEGDGSAKSKILKSIRKMNSTLGFWKHGKHEEHSASTQYRSTTLQAF
ncbi:hypothetical protein BKA69DRAFT_787255 [Paraphysoderma sedebokerense]|nr:hypothetical protein BKA69DRAFT_787255 [Paraphysoderma sedebokerense]